MTWSAWWSMDSMEFTDPAEAQQALEEAWSRYYPHGGRGVAVGFGRTVAGEMAAPLMVDADIDEGRARLRWVQTCCYAQEPGIPAHPRPLLVEQSPYQQPVSVPGAEALVTPGAALRAVVEFTTTGQRPTFLEWITVARDGH